MNRLPVHLIIYCCCLLGLVALFQLYVTINGHIFDYNFSHGSRLSLLFGVLAIAGISWFALYLLELHRPSGWLETVSRKVTKNAYSGVFTISLFAIFLAACVSHYALLSFPNSGDEYAFVFQAETYLQGRLWNPPPPLQGFFAPLHTFYTADRWFAQYPPGWPGMLTILQLLHIPMSLAASVIGGALVAAVYWLTRLTNSRMTALAVAAGLAVSPFFVFNAASYFNHLPTALFMVLFSIAGMYFLQAPKKRYAFYMGMAVGVVGLTRHPEAIFCVLPFLFPLAATRSWITWGKSLFIFAGGASFLAILMYYNYRITGDPLLPVQSWGGTTGSFVAEDTEALEEASSRNLDVLLEMSEWATPLLLPLFLVAIAYKIRNREFRFYDSYIIIIVLTYFFWNADPGNRYGPRYYFPAYPFMLVTVGTALGSWAEKFKDRGEKNMLGHAVAVYMIVCVVSLGYCFFFQRSIIWERLDLYRQVEARGLEDAIVFMANGTGVKRYMYIADLRRNGVDLDLPVLYAHDNGDYNLALRRYFPDRTYWRYERDDDKVEGQLTRFY